LTLVAVAASLLLLAFAIFAAYRQAEKRRTSSEARKAQEHSAHATPTPQLSERALKDTAWDPAWPPLPEAGTPAKPIEQVRAIYAFAARHPEVLQYAPCYCGCESGGHHNAHDCFVKGRAPNGRPQWDGMGFI
jgi:ABC-type nickel/cobalt efflux system permease component RcnA